MTEAVAWLMQLVTGFLPLRSVFDPRSCYMGFVVDSSAGGGFSLSTLVSPANSHSANCFAFINHPII
jgi:hypothetical protein